ncbi:phosphonate ABC transporter, permease protein PhnE [Natronococcus pandeyae]|uniref:Phosphonate ABC transporter, permease protein PhnE n=1 Tax=Natronococcus pandeyae TaxID=2055836 RepID=A0A8J8TPS2_9EURY|nr:phosphonate ABC transporter, permease protein PhnE [Natronococcus pandeyae]TYL36145.1 phosphonate ABC transporter, permease protein PhnE [Natronococcus pandeyae]
MAEGTTTIDRRTWDRPTVFYNRYVKYLVYLALVGFLAWSVWEMRVSPDRLLAGGSAASNFLTESVPPDFGAQQRELIWSGMVESIAMAIIATVLGVIVSIPVGFMAAENISPKPLYVLNRGIISFARAFHELVIAIVLVIAVGVGPLAGIITLSFKTVGFFGKLISEEIEEIDEKQTEAIRATGANTAQVMLYGVLPQVTPRIVGLSIYRWDINLRSSTIVGIVGAGGIGLTLLHSFERYEYDFTLAIILVILALVLLGEAISAVIRRRIQ